MMDKVMLDGIVEADETFMPISYKGHHKRFKLPRPAHKRGTPATKRGLSKEQVCIPCFVNLDGKSIAKVGNLGKPSYQDLEKVLNGKINKDVVLVTDMLRPYLRVSKNIMVQHIRIPPKEYKNGTFNIQKVNSYHSHFKNMVIHRFKGVSTKYLNNYLLYHNFVNFAKGSLEKKKQRLFEFVRDTFYFIKTLDISNKPAIPI